MSFPAQWSHQQAGRSCLKFKCKFSFCRTDFLHSLCRHDKSPTDVAVFRPFAKFDPSSYQRLPRYATGIGYGDRNVDIMRWTFLEIFFANAAPCLMRVLYTEILSMSESGRAVNVLNTGCELG